MKELLKKSTAVLLTLIMLISTLTMLPITASAAGDSIATATPYTLSNTVYGSITETNTVDIYKFDLSSSGKITLNVDAYIKETSYYLYNCEGNQVWECKWKSWNSVTQKLALTEEVNLTSGSYYLSVNKGIGTGEYNFRIDFTSANESFKEITGGINNEISSASIISTNTSYKGQIANNDEKDFYSFSLSASGKINISLDAYIPETSYYLYDSEGNQVWECKWQNWNSTSKKLTLNEDVNLTSGTYYFSVVKGIGYGNYNFNLNFTSANESFKETSWGVNNDISNASKISLNKSYKGQIANNDEKDFYSFSLSTSGKINISLDAYIPETSYYLYDSEGNQVWECKWQNWNSTSKKFTLNENLNLTSGTYYFSVVKGVGYGNYNFTLKYTSANESFKETSWGTNNDISNANKISLGKSYIGQIANNDEKDFYSFTVSKSGKYSINLSAYIQETSYYLYDENGYEIWNTRWRNWDNTSKKFILNETFDLSKGTYYFCVSKGIGHGNYTFNVSKVIPAPVIKSASNVSGGIKVTWNKISGATGYKVYRKAGSETKWTLVSTINSSSTISYSDKNVKNGTTYKYVVKAYEGSFNSALSNTVGIRRLANPSVKSAVNATKGVKVTWGKVTGASGYYIYRKESNAKSWSKIGTAKGNSTTYFTDTKAKNGTTYTYTVRAYYGSTMSSFNSGIKVKRLANPVIKSIANANSGITIKWGKVTGASGYEVYRKAGNAKTWTKVATIKDVSFTDKKVKSGTSYRYTIRAYSGSIKSSYNNGNVLKRLSTPSVKSAANATAGVKVTWGKVTGASGYQVYRKVNTSTKWVLVATIKSGSTVAYTDKNVKSGYNYRYTVRAYSGSSRSSFTNGVITKRLANPPLKSIANATSGIKVNWGKVTGAKGYQVYRKAGNAKTWTLVANIKSGTTVTYLDKNVKKGVKYTYTVRAYNGSIKSSYYGGIYRTR